jgi:NitT/TauT family transport system substrate-binding protein
MKIKTGLIGFSLLFAIIAGYVWQIGFPSLGAPPEKISIGVDRAEFNSLVWIAQNRGFDKENGIEITIKTFQAGRDALKGLRSGQLDLACCAEFVLVGGILAGQANLRCLSVLAAGEIDELVASQDKGISRPEDLRGKTIGVPLGTSAEFFLGRFLTSNQVALKEVNIVNVNPFDLADALAGGKVDAVLAWEPITCDIRKINHSTISWPAQEGQDLYWLLIAQEEVVQRKTAAMENLLRALVQAANFLKEHPVESRAIVTQWMNVPIADLQAGKFTKRHKLFLDQGLLLAMEDEARWMMRNKLTEQTQLPDFLDYFYVAPLSRVAPRAVQIIIPKDKRPVAPSPVGIGQVHR